MTRREKHVLIIATLVMLFSALLAPQAVKDWEIVYLTPLAQSRQIDPSFPAPMTIFKGLQTVREFFYFARSEWPTRYKPIKESWIELLQPPRHARTASQFIEHEFYTLEELRRLLAVSAETLHQQRAQAGAALLFLSGMRLDTLASLRTNCIDVSTRQILQFPNMGVRTKNNKAAITYLLNIPDVLEVVHRWDQHVRGFAPGSLWYASLAFDGCSLVESNHAIEGRGTIVGDDLRMLCDRAGLPYRSSHKFRHGHQYGRNEGHLSKRNAWLRRHYRSGLWWIAHQ